MKLFLKLFSSAFWLFTLYPNEGSRLSGKEQAQSTAIFPLIGMVMGALLSAFHKVMSFALPEDVVDFLVILLIAAFSGGRHLVSLAEMIAIFFATEPGKRKYLKTNQGFLVILSQLVKYYALNQVPSAMKTVVIFLLPMTSGWTLVIVCCLAGWFLKPANPQPDFTRQVTWKEIAAATGITLTVFALFLKLKGLVIVIIMVLFCLIFVKTYQGREFDGKALGACNELSQLLFLISFRLLYGDF